ncbi:glycosyltransferase family 4 protein [candidate division KSB1 bacterium]|nr:glycosyltransferase [candidate division KSB1 bacterium]RQW01096.1 MAG: glycosyltransferase family 4 protein [candidate division KSB1 bacterium]
MNLLIISEMYPSKRHPTSAIFFANLLKELKKHVGALCVICPRPYIPRLFQSIKPALKKWFIDDMFSVANGIEIYRPFIFKIPFDAFAGLNGLLMYTCLKKRLTKIVYEKKIDIILGYNMLPEGIAAVKLAQHFQRFSGFWAIGSDVNTVARANMVNALLTTRCLNKSHIIFTESTDLKNSLAQLGKKDRDVYTFYKGIHLANFHNLPSRVSLVKKLRLPAEEQFLLFVGRVFKEKGIYELADCFIKLCPIYPDLSLVFVGEEIEKETLIGRFARSSVQHKVHFTGIQPYQHVACYMKISSLLVLPSWAEGLPNVILEAMAVGLPVVATDVGGIPEVLKNNLTGLSVPAKDTDALCHAVRSMLDNKSLRDTCIRNAQKLVEQHFDVQKNTLELHRMLAALITKGTT